MEKEPDTWLGLLFKVPVVGDGIATVLGLLPLWPLVHFVKNDAWLCISASVVLTLWLLMLERLLRITIRTPFVPIKILWLMPFAFVAGVAGFFVH